VRGGREGDEGGVGDGGRGRGRGGLTGTSTLRNMAMPLRASLRAMSWGVETMMAPVWGGWDELGWILRCDLWSRGIC